MKLPPTLARERLSPGVGLPPWTRREHAARYRFCAGFVTDRTVVDCACGSGEGSAVFLAAGPASLHGFDADPAAVAMAAAINVDPRAGFAAADATSLPLAGGTADVFIALETIEHVRNDGAFVREAARVLRPGGWLIASTPNRLLTNPGTGIGDAPWNPFHVREYSPGEFAALLAPWFDVEQQFGQNPANEAHQRFFERLARRCGPRSAVRFRQFGKLRWLLPASSRHDVVPAALGRVYEYTVLVGRRRP